MAQVANNDEDQTADDKKDDREVQQEYSIGQRGVHGAAIVSLRNQSHRMHVSGVQHQLVPLVRGSGW